MRLRVAGFFFKSTPVVNYAIAISLKIIKKFVQDLETRLIPNNIRNQTAELKMADCQWCLCCVRSSSV